MRDQRARGLDALRHALATALLEIRLEDGLLLATASGGTRVAAPGGAGDRPGRGSGDPPDDHDRAAASVGSEAEQRRLIALVELARTGDKDAFGQLYDHYSTQVYRFVYYRVGSVPLAEDLTGETFFRALRGMNGFRWQGKDFGAWLTTIARNLVTDHYKSGRSRLETVTEDDRTLDRPTQAEEGPEAEVLASLTNEALLGAVRELPRDQQDCLVLRFLQGRSIAETAEALERSEGAVKQLQLRAVRGLAALLPEGVR